jgi:hypothetical protein
MCVTVARYGYTRKQHPDPERFDAAVDDGIRGELALKQAPPSGVIQ